MHKCSTIFIALYLVLNSICPYAQDLIHSRQDSYYTLIYKISGKQALELYSKRRSTLPPDYFLTLVDFYPTDSTYSKSLSPGHYLHVKTVSNEFEYTLESVDNLEMRILNNSRDLSLLFYDLNGNNIKSLRPSLRNQKIPYDKTSQSYKLTKTNRRGWIVVSYNQHDNLFFIEREVNNTFLARAKRRIRGTFPVNHLISTFMYIPRNVKSLIKYGHVSPPGIYYRVKRLFDVRSFEGYVALNKPKYKPGDTVKVKGYFLTKRGKPVKRKLEVSVQGYYPRYESKVLGTPDMPWQGAYLYEFVLVDSLDLNLDQSYSIQFDDKRYNSYPQASFRYEQYELKKNEFSLSTTPNFHPAEPDTLVLSGKDSNGLPLYDINVELVAYSKAIHDFYEKDFFIKDTLWSYTTHLDPAGDTKVKIPDSVYADASFDYMVTAAFTNSENERHEKSVTLLYNSRANPIESKLKEDSVLLSLQKVAEVRTDYLIMALDPSGNILYEKTVNFPHSEKMESMVSELQIYNKDELIKKINFENESEQIEVLANRTKDSLTLSVYNPRKILFRYQLFRNNRIIKDGTEVTLDVKLATTPKVKYYISIQYLWAGHSKVQDYNLAYSRKTLKIEVDHQLNAFPGEKVDFEVSVKDALNKPAGNVDLTAYAITKNFGPQNPEVPTFEKLRSRKLYNTFNKSNRSIKRIKEKLNYDFWELKLGLDSIEYFQFLYPDQGMYFNSSNISANITQIAPYVVDDGRIVPIQYVYFDKELKFFAGTQGIVPYSFETSNDKVNIKLRLLDQLLTIPNVIPTPGKKLILSIDLNNLPDSIRNEEQPSQLTPDELKKIASHIMWVSRSDDQSRSYFQQGHRFYLLAAENRYGQSIDMVGPFFPGQLVDYQTYFSIPFRFKPNMIYQFEPNLIDRESSIIKLNGRAYTPLTRFSLKDEVITELKIREYWKSLEKKQNYNFQMFASVFDASKVKGDLLLKAKLDVKNRAYAAFAMNLDYPDKYFIYPGTKLELKELPPGHYEVALVLDDESYIKTKAIYVTPFGRTFHDVTSSEIKPADQFSKEVMKKIKKWATSSTYVVQDRQGDMQDLRQYYYQEAASAINYYGGRWITGRVTSIEDGDALPGVTVIVKGTTIGTITNIDGEYELYVPLNGVIIFSFIGFKTEEMNTGLGQILDLKMEYSVSQLSEIVVTGYGVSTEKRALSYSIATLQGRIPGVSIGNEMGVKIRGVSSNSGLSEPIIIIDGRLGTLSNIDENSITAIEILKSDQAVALYGERASRGVILISTKQGATRLDLLKTKFPGDDQLLATGDAETGNSLRKNFKDYSFWQPKLITNREGKVKFQATLPDDITAWDIYVMGVGSKKKTGLTKSRIQSYRPLVAQLAIPNFLVQGDSTLAIGKITNYTQDTLQLIKSIEVNNQHNAQDIVKVKNLIVDSIAIVGVLDTINIKYQIKHKGYTDGELRQIRVLPKGTKESNGFFFALPMDTIITIQFDSTSGPLKLYAQTDLIDVVLDEIKSLKLYPYECNEQLASKLKAMLSEKAILKLKGEKDGNDKFIERSIRLLSMNQNIDGAWSWWGSSENSSLWITLHVAEALDRAEKMGYKVKYDWTGLRSYLMKMEAYTLDEELRVYSFLAKKGEKVLTPRPHVADSILAKKTYSSNYLKLLLMQVYQLVGDSIDWDWVESQRKETLKGNWYWGETKNSQWNNDVDNTLLVYQLMERKNEKDPNLIRLRNFFLEKRSRSWTNTYQSSRIIEVLLPSLLRDQKPITKPSMNISGDMDIDITKFPFETTLENVKSFTIAKKGTSPIYFTAFQDTWNSNPNVVEKDFVVKTQWEGDQNILQAGTPFNLMVMVDVKKDAEYVMINIPIPAGCSYSNRNRNRSNGEVYREYDIQETRIYCEKLRAGKYEYSIQLLPRYNGRFTINPAKIEWMYFPTIYGRESMKSVFIR